MAAKTIDIQGCNENMRQYTKNGQNAITNNGTWDDVAITRNDVPYWPF